MALNLNDRLVIMRGAVMQTRCTAGVLQFALYILGDGTVDGSPPTDAHKGWAREAVRDPNSTGSAVSNHLLDNTDFLAAGSGITDQQLQGAIETAVKSRFIAS